MSARTMTCKERFVEAIHCREVDYVPMMINFWDNYMVDARTKEKKVWHNEQERLDVYKSYGWDTSIYVYVRVSPLKEVLMRRRLEQDGAVLFQQWVTPAGTLEERLSMSEDWPEAQHGETNIPLGHDFRTSRYIESPFKDDASYDALPYLFPEYNPIDEEAIAKEFAEKKLGRKIMRYESTRLSSGEIVFVDSGTCDPVTGLYRVYKFMV